MTPITESRSDSRPPSRPSRRAATTAPASAPYPTPTPSSSAAAAPVKASSAVPCTANDMRRMTMSGPNVPATSPSTAAASSAVRTKSKPSSSIVRSMSNNWSMRKPSSQGWCVSSSQSALCAPATWIWPPTLTTSTRER